MRTGHTIALVSNENLSKYDKSKKKPIGTATKLADNFNLMISLNKAKINAKILLVKYKARLLFLTSSALGTKSVTNIINITHTNINFSSRLMNLKILSANIAA